MSDAVRKLAAHEEFLQGAVDTALAKSIITTADIIAKFTPADVMKGFEERPDRRADLLAQCTGMNRRQTAARIQPEAAAELLSLALDESETNPGQIWEILTSADLVRHQLAATIWEMVFATRWPDRPSQEHKEMMEDLLKAAIRLHLLDDDKTKTNTHYEMVKSVGVDQFMSNRVPAEKRTEVLKSALAMGEGVDKPFRGEDLLEMLKPADLVQYLELPVLERVLLKIAAKYGWQRTREEQPEVPPETSDLQGVDEHAGDAVELPEIPSDGIPDDGVLELDADEPSGVTANPFGSNKPASEPAPSPPQPMFPVSADAALTAMGRTDDIDAALTGLGVPPPQAPVSRSSSGRHTPPPPPPRRR